MFEDEIERPMPPGLAVLASVLTGICIAMVIIAIAVWLVLFRPADPAPSSACVLDANGNCVERL